MIMIASKKKSIFVKETLQSYKKPRVNLILGRWWWCHQNKKMPTFLAVSFHANLSRVCQASAAHALFSCSTVMMVIYLIRQMMTLPIPTLDQDSSFLRKMTKVYYWLFISWQNLCISNTLSLKTDDEAFNPHSGPEIKFVCFLAAALFLIFLERSNLLWTSLLIRTSFFYFSSAHVEASGCNFKALCRKGHVVSH